MKYKEMKPTELIDMIENIEIDEIDKAYDALTDKEFFKYLQEQITYNNEQFEKFQKEVNEELHKLSMRLDKIDNFWNIANKLEMILAKLGYRDAKPRRKQV